MGELDAWDLKDEICNGQITLYLVQNMCTGIVGATAATTWANLQTQFASGGISSIYQDFKAAMAVKIGMSNPAKDMMTLFTYLGCLQANQVMIPGYIQGMMLLNMIPLNRIMLRHIMSKGSRWSQPSHSVPYELLFLVSSCPVVGTTITTRPIPQISVESYSGRALLLML